MKNNWPHIHAPQLIVDEARVRRNIRRMVDKASRLGKELRPHYKTHQSKTIGRWCREEGIRKITVSSVGMAEYFASDGWNDITIAFPCNIRQADRINVLAEQVELKLLADSGEVIAEINRKIKYPVEIFIEIDAGSHRTGVPYDEADKLNELFESISSGPHQVAGIYTHCGHLYACRSSSEVKAKGLEAIQRMEQAAQSIKGSVPRVCYGDTPSCTVLEDFGKVITDISPGNFVFYDMMQVEIGSCTRDDVAVAVVCPVVTGHPENQTFTIHGGAVHFSKDRLDDGSFGRIVSLDEKTWTDHERGSLVAISQEHGTLHADGFETGEVVAILPVHSCLTAECMSKYLSTNGVYIDHYQKSR